MAGVDGLDATGRVVARVVDEVGSGEASAQERERDLFLYAVGPPNSAHIHRGVEEQEFSDVQMVGGQEDSVAVLEDAGGRWGHSRTLHPRRGEVKLSE
jgi:hypothetical protein